MIQTVFTPRHWLHDTRALVVNGKHLDTEELPERVEVIRQAIQEAQLGPIVEPQDFGFEPLLKVHGAEYLDFLSNIYNRVNAQSGSQHLLIPETFSSRAPRRKPLSPLAQLGYYCFGTFTPILRGTWEAAYWSAQCALTAAHIVQKHHTVAYALCRPPGHHAGRELYGGYCYLNNAAIAARSLNERVAIVDIDFHHGNGSQEIFYDDPQVLYCSLHANPEQEYPYFWGRTDEKGASKGYGANLNIPLPLNCTDQQYLESLDICLKRVQEFHPAYLIVSLGLDIVRGDPAGGFDITPKGLSEIARRIATLTQKGLPTILVQEGGYLIQTLGENAVKFLKHFSRSGTL